MTRPTSPARMPLLFVGHGSPMNAVEDNAWTREWEDLGRALPRPRAILCISAHFVTRGWYAVDTPNPRTIHDFYGFPPELYAARYPAPGAPEMAARVVELLGRNASPTSEWGLDHGAWSVLTRAYPQADIPVCQLSLDLRLSPGEQMDVGRALAPLREEGVLILGSGNVVHNLREVRMNAPQPFSWAKSFGEGMQEIVLSGNWAQAQHYEDIPGWSEAIATREHFLPLLNVLGAAHAGDRARAFNHEYVWGSLSMTGYALEPAPEPVNENDSVSAMRHARGGAAGN